MIGNLSAAIFTPGAVLGDYESIATVTLTSGQSAIEFTSIPSTFQHLQIRLIGKSQFTGGTGPDNFQVQYNSDTTQSNYYRHNLRGSGSGSGDTPAGNDNLITSSISTSADNANIFGVMVMDILDYANTNKYTTTRHLSGIDYNGSGFVQLGSMLWKNTAAITSIKMLPGSGWAAKTQIALYGIKG